MSIVNDYCGSAVLDMGRPHRLRIVCSPMVARMTQNSEESKRDREVVHLLPTDSSLLIRPLPRPSVSSGIYLLLLVIRLLLSIFTKHLWNFQDFVWNIFRA